MNATLERRNGWFGGIVGEEFPSREWRGDGLWGAIMAIIITVCQGDVALSRA